MEPFLLVERDGPVVIATFNRPDERNAISRPEQAEEVVAFAHAMTKRMMQMEWAMSVDDAIEAEAVAQALCMHTEDFTRAFHAFANKSQPVFEGD